MENFQYAEVIPLVKLPKSLGIFDYKIPAGLIDEIQIGQLVEIPFRKKNIFGIIIKLKKDAGITHKNLKEIVSIKNKKILAPYQIDLIFWLADNYFQSLALIVKSLIPPIPKKNYFNKFDVKSSSGITIKKNIQKALFDISGNTLIYGDYPKTLPIQIINAYRKKNQQILYLLPETNIVRKKVKIIEKYFNSSEIGVITGTISKTKNYILWEKILHKEIKIIIGTRRAIFSPFSDLGAILIEDEDDQSYKQWDQNPRYNAREVAIKISELTHSNLFLFSRAPSVTTYSKTLKNFNKKFYPWYGKQFEMVDIKNEPKSFPYRYISNRVNEVLEQSQGQCIVMINRKGSSRLVLCKSCGYIFRCPACNLPYAYYATPQEVLRCTICAKTLQLPEKCPECENIEYKFQGAGTKKIAEEIQTRYPKYALEILDGDTPMKKKKEIIADFKNKKIKILIATQSIFNDIQVEHPIDAVIILSTDILFNIPEYTSEERAWQFIIKSSMYANTIIIQTNNTDNFAVSCIAKNDFDAWYMSELKKRKLFHYPPFSKIIKIIFQNKNKKNAETDASLVAKKIKEIIKFDNLSIEVFGPIDPYAIITRKYYRVHIILKILKNNELLQNIMQTVPESCLIDVDPVSLL